MHQCFSSLPCPVACRVTGWVVLLHLVRLGPVACSPMCLHGKSARMHAVHHTFCTELEGTQKSSVWSGGPSGRHLPSVAVTLVTE